MSNAHRLRLILAQGLLSCVAIAFVITWTTTPDTPRWVLAAGIFAMWMHVLVVCGTSHDAR